VDGRVVVGEVAVGPEASTPTMIAAPWRATSVATRSGSSTAAVPMIARATPNSSACATAAASRRPPPSCTGMGMASTIARISAVCTGRPWRAPSRSTTCSRVAPASYQPRATATGSSPNTVTREKSP